MVALGGTLPWLEGTQRSSRRFSPAAKLPPQTRAVQGRQKGQAVSARPWLARAACAESSPLAPKPLVRPPQAPGAMAKGNPESSSSSCCPKTPVRAGELGGSPSGARLCGAGAGPGEDALMAKCPARDESCPGAQRGGGDGLEVLQAAWACCLAPCCVH